MVPLRDMHDRTVAVEVSPPLGQRPGDRGGRQHGADEAEVGREIAARVLELRGRELQESVEEPRLVEHELVELRPPERHHRLVRELLGLAEQHLLDEQVEHAVAHTPEATRLGREPEAVRRDIPARLAERHHTDGEHRRTIRRSVEKQRDDAGEGRLDEDRVGREIDHGGLERAGLVGDRLDEDRLHVVLQLGYAAIPVAVGEVVLDDAVVEVGDAAERAVAGARRNDGVAEPRPGEHGDVVASPDEVVRDRDDGSDVALDGARAEQVVRHGLKCSGWVPAAAGCRRAMPAEAAHEERS